MSESWVSAGRPISLRRPQAELGEGVYEKLAVTSSEKMWGVLAEEV